MLYKGTPEQKKDKKVNAMMGLRGKPDAQKKFLNEELIPRMERQRSNNGRDPDLIETVTEQVAWEVMCTIEKRLTHRETIIRGVGRSDSDLTFRNSSP